MDAYEQAMYGMAPSYELTEEEKKQLKMQQLISMGAALMAGRGNFVNNLGQALLVGQNQGSEGMQDLRRNKLADSQMQWQQMQIADKQRSYNKELAAQQLAEQNAARLAEWRKNAPYSPQPAPVPQGPTPTTYAAFGMAPPEPTNPQAQAQAQGEYERLYNLYKYWEDKDEGQAKLYFERADKVRDEFGLTPQEVLDPSGKRKLVVGSKRGVTKEWPYAPEAPIGKVNPGDYTGEQLARFAASGGNWNTIGRPLDKRNISKTEVNLPPGQTKFDDEIGLSSAKRYSDYIEAAKTSRNKLARISAINEMLQGIQTGGSAPLYTKIQNYLDSVGIKLPAPGDKAGEAELNLWKKTAAEKLSKEAALHSRNPAGGAGLTGNMSNMDLQFLIDMTPGLTDTEGGRKIHMEMLRRLAKRDADIARMASRHAMGNPKLFDINLQDEIDAYDAKLSFKDLADQARAIVSGQQRSEERTRHRGN